MVMALPHSALGFADFYVECFNPSQLGQVMLLLHFLGAFGAALPLASELTFLHVSLVSGAMEDHGILPLIATWSEGRRERLPPPLPPVPPQRTWRLCNPV